MSENENVEVQFLGLSQDGKSKVIDVEGKKGWWPKMKEFRIVGGIYDVEMQRKEDGSPGSMYNGTALYLRQGDMTDEDIVRNAAGEKQLTMKKMENKLKKNFDEEHIGELTLNQIRSHAICMNSPSERAALMSKIACYVGLF